MSDRTTKTRAFQRQHSKAVIDQPIPTLMYIIIDDRAVFDAIPLEVMEHVNFLSKSQQSPDGFMIVFQWWPPRDQPTKELVLELLPSAEEANERTADLSLV